jgi:hypothetical protein
MISTFSDLSARGESRNFETGRCSWSTRRRASKSSMRLSLVIHTEKAALSLSLPGISEDRTHFNQRGICRMKIVKTFYDKMEIHAPFRHKILRRIQGILASRLLFNFQMNTFKQGVGISVLALASLGTNAATILSPGATWEYTFANPTGDADWNTTSGGWSTGAAPFGNTVGGDFGNNTFWPVDGVQGDDDLWVRTTIDLTGFDLTTAHWDLGVDNAFKLYANGTLVSAADAGGFTFRWEYSGGFPVGLLTPGINYIAVALDDYGGLTAFDMQILADPRAPTVPDGGSTLALLSLGVAVLASARRRTRAT